MPDKRQGKPKERRTHLEKNGTRRHLYTEQSRLSLSAALPKGLLSGSVDASLEEIDNSSLLSNGDVRVGPFAVLKLTPSPDLRHGPLASDEAERPIVATISDGPINTSSTSSTKPAGENFLPFPDDLLQWPDLFGLDDDLSGITSNLPLSLGQYPDFASYSSLIGSENDTYNASLSVSLEPTSGTIGFHDTMSKTRADIPHTGPSATHSETPINVLSEASFLLNIFQNHLASRLTVVPLGQKTPWSTLNVPAAIVTLGDMTILDAPDINHARQANLYSLLACAASYIGMTPSHQLSTPASADYWKQIATQSYNDAKDHLRLSLNQETDGPAKAKYKEQLMAIFAMMESAIFQGQHQDARCYILDAERLLRLRGLPKRRTSRKARLLINVYAWLRIVGESTYVLHDYSAPDSFVKTLSHRIHICESITHNTASGSTTERDLRLDDFLHLEDSDNDLNIDDPKDQNKDITDIHLQDSRKSLYTLGKQVYGISETWLSLVSQTTRLANVMEKLRTAQNSELLIESKVWNFLQERSHRLENVVHSFASREADPDPPEAPSSPYSQILRALNAALVILFYRRIRRVHPAILESQVEKVVVALGSFDVGTYHAGPGFLWPIFLAGCEATKTTQRDAILRLIKDAENNCGLAPFKIAKDIMTGLWQMHDENLAANRRESLPTWIDVLKKQQIWPMFC